MRLCASLLLACTFLSAEVHNLSLRQAATRALAQNPDVLMARLDEQKAALQIRIARDPFIPKVYAGSGLAYSYGFPMSIEGSAPSVVQARAVSSVYNRSKTYALAQSKEQARGMGFVTQTRGEDAVLRTIELWLDAEHAARSAEAAAAQVEAARKLEVIARNRVEGGAELPIEVRKAVLETAKAAQRAQSFQADRELLEATLANVLGYEPGDRVRPVPGERALPEVPQNEAAARAEAWKQSKELRKLESDLMATELQTRSARATRLPTLDLVAQYGLFARFNNYDEYFNRFQRNNAQLGVSITVPLFLGAAAQAQATQAALQTARLRTEIQAARNRIALGVDEDFLLLRRAQTALEVSRLDLDVARESLSVLLKRHEMGEGSLADVEAARRLESEKWIAWLGAQHQIERARFALLHRTGALLAAIQ
ncbi:MAG TPA: TolC family protein [Bryobacteraceae bacterium]|nr:TolC family protein [Bryobacteraceae bacterium]